MIPYHTPAWMVYTDDSMVGVERVEAGIPMTPVCFLVKGRAEEMAEQCGGVVEESTVGIFFDSHEMLGLNTAMEDEQRQIHFVLTPTRGG